MPPFLRSLLLGSLGYMLVGFLPLIGGMIGWFILAFSAVGFIQNALRSNPGITNLTGYGLGMGFLLGTSIRLLGGLGGVLLTALFASNSSDSTSTGLAVSGLWTTINLPYTIFTAPLVGGLFGLLGGLIGSSLAPKALPSSRA